MPDNRPPAYLEGSVAVYRASAMGSCLKVLVSARRGITPAAPPPKMRAAFQRGHDNEDRIMSLAVTALDLSQPIVGRQQQIEIPVGQRAVIRGHIDGYTTEHDAVIDAKNLGKSRIKSFEREGIAGLGPLGVKYAIQGILYCAGMGMGNMIFVAPVVSAVDGADGALFHSYGIPELNDIAGTDIGGLKVKVMLAEKHARDATFPECDEQDYPCPYYFLHAGYKQWDSDDDYDDSDLEHDDAVALESLGVAYEEAKVAEKIAKDNKDTARAQLMKMVEPGDKKSAGTVTVSHREQKGRMVFDEATARLDGVDIDRYMVRGKGWPVLTVKVKEDAQ